MLSFIASSILEKDRRDAKPIRQLGPYWQDQASGFSVRSMVMELMTTGSTGLSWAPVVTS